MRSCTTFLESPVSSSIPRPGGSFFVQELILLVSLFSPWIETQGDSIDFCPEQEAPDPFIDPARDDCALNLP